MRPNPVARHTTTSAKRVLLLADTFWPVIGGAEVQSLRLINALRGHGCEFTIVTDYVENTAAEEVHDEVPVFRLPFSKTVRNRNPAEIFELKHRALRIVNAFRPDIVHAIAYGPSAFFLQFLSANGTPTLLEVCMQYSEVAADDQSAIGRALRRATWVTTNSTATLEHVQRLVPEVAGRSSRVHYGIPVPDITPTPLQTSPPHLVCFGRLVPEKGFDVALMALPAVLRQFPDARLTIAGDGVGRKDLERLVHEQGIGDAVTFLGWVGPDRIPQLINEASIVLMPSRWEESFGLVAAETALMSRPIVATRVGGLPEVVADGETGVLIDKDDPDALAQATISLLCSPQRAADIGARARERAIQLFSVDRYVEEYLALYAHCLNGAHTTLESRGMK